MSVLFTDQYFLLASLLSSMVGDELINEHLDEDKHKQDGDGAGREKKHFSCEKVPGCHRSPFMGGLRPASNLKMVLGSFSTLGFTTLDFHATCDYLENQLSLMPSTTVLKTAGHIRAMGQGKRFTCGSRFAFSFFLFH